MVATVISPTPSLGFLTPTATRRWYQPQAKTVIPDFYSFITLLSTLYTNTFIALWWILLLPLLLRASIKNNRILNPSAISTKPFLDKEYIRMFWQYPFQIPVPGGGNMSSSKDLGCPFYQVMKSTLIWFLFILNSQEV